jgi:Tfp pilus assembly protein PilF
MYVVPAVMRTRIVLAASLLATTSLIASARDKAENWVQVRSPHFLVATNSNEKQARRVADQFERMRSVFHILFPKLQLDPGAPIVVLAVDSEKDFQALEPEAYLAKGQLKLAGLFLHTEDKNYVLMRLQAEGEHPYAVVFHEYTHALLAKDAEFLPLWFNEGLAEVYETMEIENKDVLLGKPDWQNVLYLRQHPLLPLDVLFKVDTKSPYYHEENKGSVFYAQSWALLSYIQERDRQNNTHQLKDYLDLLVKNIDPVTAASTAFGDLQQLQTALAKFVAKNAFTYYKNPTRAEIDDSSFVSEPLTPTASDELRADFLAYNQRTKDARSLLGHVLQQDPSNVSAHETMGFVEFREGHIDEAKKWYAKAVQLDSQSYLAHYYYAAMSMQEVVPAGDEAQIENSLRRAIKLNPSFAPSFDRLAVFLGSRNRDLDEAHMLGLTAVSLDPSNVGYRLNVANVLMAMHRGKNAVTVLENAAKLAKTPEESQWIENALSHAQEFQAEQERIAEEERHMDEMSKASPSVASSAQDGNQRPVPRLVRREFVASGPHHFVTGVIQDVHCELQNMDLAVSSGGKSISLHSENYYKLQYSTLGFQASGDLKPCSDLAGRPAKVEYEDSANKTELPRLLSIELHK